MFCTNCGKELPDGAKFCAFCGTVISIEPQQTQKQKPSEVSIPDQSNENISQDSNNTGGNEKQQKSAILPKKKGIVPIVVIGIVAVLVVAVVVSIFSIRAYNERDMIRQIPWAVYNDDTSNKITAYYEDYLGKDIMIGCDAEDFSVEQGSDSNSFDFVGKIQVTDLSQDGRPTYDANVTGTVTTNFFRTKYHLTYQLAYEEPEARLTYNDLVGQYVAGPEYDYIYPRLDISIDGSSLWISLGTAYGGDGCFEAEFAPESNWPKIKSNSIQFTAEEVWWDATYDITLEFIPSVKSPNGKDTVYLKGPHQFEDWEFTRLGSSGGAYGGSVTNSTGEYDDITGTYIDEYGDGFYMFIGYEDSSKQTAYLEVGLVTEVVLVELNERYENTIYGTDFNFYPQATSPSQVVELDYNPYNGSITAIIYTASTGDFTLRFIPCPNAPYSNPFYVD